MSIDLEIKRLFKRKFPLFDNTQLNKKVEYLTQDSQDRFYVLLYNRGREGYDRSKINRDESPFIQVFNKPDEFIAYGNLTIICNNYPNVENQIILFPNEIRENLLHKDLVSVIQFSKESEFAIILNQRLSGASILNHLHFQGIDTYFPVMNQCEASLLVNHENISLERIIFPSYGVRFSGDEVAIADMIMGLEDIHKTYNLFFNRGKVNFVPRCIEIPSELGKWQFGSTEISGLFFPRNFDQFNSINARDLARALEETTFNKKRELIDGFEAKLHGLMGR